MNIKSGVQRVLCVILTDWGLWVTGTNKQQDLRVLFQKIYFDPEDLSSFLDERVNILGGWLEFLPKYHPRFNFIDVYWGYVKRKVRNGCYYNWNKFLEDVPEALDTLPLILMRMVFSKFCRYIDRYRVVLIPAQVEIVSKNYQTHRIISADFLNDLFLKTRVSYFWPNEV